MKMRRLLSHRALASEASGGLDRPLRGRIHPLIVVKRISVEITALIGHLELHRAWYNDEHTQTFVNPDRSLHLVFEHP